MRPTVEYIRQRIEFWTDKVFRQKAPVPPIKLSRSHRSLGCVRYKRNRITRSVSDFSIAFSGVYEFTEELLDDVILHELIHYHILYFQYKDTSAHGKLFRAMMANINKNYNRNISITHRPDGKTGRRNYYYICICKLADGRYCVASTGKSLTGSIDRIIMQDKNIVGRKWIRTSKEFFEKIPRHDTFRAYYVPIEELREQLGAELTAF